jgi:hypothetical protein
MSSIRADGPKRLPKEVTREARTLRLFVTYLCRPATERELLLGERSAEDRTRLKDCLGELSRLSVIQEQRLFLRHLVMCAPALNYMVSRAWTIRNKRILPEEAIPSYDCCEACTQAYHAWVRQISRGV